MISEYDFMYDDAPEFFKLFNFLSNLGLHIKYRSDENYLYGYNTTTYTGNFETNDPVLIGFCTTNDTSWKCLSGNVIITNSKFKDYKNKSRYFSWGDKSDDHPVILPLPISDLQLLYIKYQINIWMTRMAYNKLIRGDRNQFVRDYKYEDMLLLK